MFGGYGARVGVGAALPSLQGTRAPSVEERVRSREHGPSDQRLASPTAVPAAGWAVERTTGPHPTCSESIADAGWGQLRRFSEYKARQAGKLVVRMPPAYSAQECCFCGALNQVPLSARVFDCRDCRKRLDRDFAAWIALKRGLAQVGQDMPELKPAEAGPLPVPTTGRASLAGDAGTIRHETVAGSPRVYSWEDVTGSRLGRR